jgi:signal transduction histidine kinase
LAQDKQSRGIDAFFEHVLESDRQAVHEALQHSLQTGEEFDLEFRLLTATGKVRWARCRGMPEWQDGQYRYPGTWSVQDVSVYHELIEERHRKNEELNLLVHARTRKLEEARRSMEELSYALSHDLRKPIRHMVSFTQLLQESLQGQESPEVARYCDRIVEAGKNAQALIHSMLRLATLGRAGVNATRVNLGCMIQGVVDELTQDEDLRHIEWRLPASWPDVHADSVLLRDVWTNLLDNAVKYSMHREQPVIEVGTRSLPGICVLYIKDNGCGFEPREADKIFALFQRAQANGSVEGSGIGLALVRRVVENHGWHISAHGQPGIGAEFRIHIPQAAIPSADHPANLAAALT